MTGPASFSVRLTDATRDQGGNLRLGGLVREDQLKELLTRAEGSEAYRNARDKYEFRIKDTGGDVFLELKRRSTGVFGKLAGFVRAPARQAERNAAIVSLAKFNDAWRSEANRKLFSDTGYRATTKATAREFHSDLVERMKADEAAAQHAAAVKKENAATWVDIKDRELGGMIAAAADRAGIGEELRSKFSIDDTLARLGIAVSDLTEQVLTPDAMRSFLDGRLDGIMQRQKAKIDEIGKLGIADPVEADIVRTALLSSAKAMPAAFFDQARRTADALMSGVERFSRIESPEARRTAAAELMKQYQAEVAAAGNVGSQEIGDFGTLVAALAVSSKADTSGRVRDALAELGSLAAEFMMDDDDVLSGAGSAARYPIFGLTDAIDRSAAAKAGDAL